MDNSNSRSKTSKVVDHSNSNKAFVSKHIATEIRKRGLLVDGKKEGATEAIKQVLGSHLNKLLHNIEDVAKNIAHKKIVTKQIVETASRML